MKVKDKSLVSHTRLSTKERSEEEMFIQEKWVRRWGFITLETKIAMFWQAVDLSSKAFHCLESCAEVCILGFGHSAGVVASDQELAKFVCLLECLRHLLKDSGFKLSRETCLVNLQLERVGGELCDEVTEVDCLPRAVVAFNIAADALKPIFPKPQNND